MRTIWQMLASSSNSPRHPKVGDRITFVKNRAKSQFGNGLQFGHARVEEVIDVNHIKVVMIEREFWEFGEEGRRILTWSETYQAWRGRRGHKVLT